MPHHPTAGELNRRQREFDRQRAEQFRRKTGQASGARSAVPSAAPPPRNTTLVALRDQKAAHLKAALKSADVWTEDKVTDAMNQWDEVQMLNEVLGDPVEGSRARKEYEIQVRRAHVR